MQQHQIKWNQKTAVVEAGLPPRIPTSHGAMRNVLTTTLLDPQRPRFPALMEERLKSKGFSQTNELLTGAASRGMCECLASQPFGQSLPDGKDGRGWLISAEEVTHKPPLAEFFEIIRDCGMTTEPKTGVELVFARHKEPRSFLFRIWAENELCLCDYICQLRDGEMPTEPLLVTTETLGQVLVAEGDVWRQAWTHLMAFAARFGELAAASVGFQHQDDVGSVRVRASVYLPLRLACRDAAK